MGQVCAKHEQFYEIECPWCARRRMLMGAAIRMRMLRHHNCVHGRPDQPWPATLDFIPPRSASWTRRPASLSLSSESTSGRQR
jgi:hypothetical protein